MRLKGNTPEEEHPEKMHDVLKRGKPQVQENSPREEDVETRKSSKHSEARKDRTPRKRKGKPHEL
ncbi:MAG: hypothetical protein Tsb0015_01990 [Simkaniaceae bacterium]